MRAKHIHWTGVVKSKIQFLEDTKAYRWLRIRYALSQQLQKKVPSRETQAFIQALTLGLSQHISYQWWNVFRKTGTIHLMVISGAHIGLITGLLFILLRSLWSFFPQGCLKFPAQSVGALGAIFGGFLYAGISGFGVPAQRAIIVCILLLLRYLTPYHFSNWQALRYALMIVLIIEPHSVLMPGFYLSFLAVGILLFASSLVQSKGWRKTLTIQLACQLGLMPFTLYWSSYGSITGLLANLVAIPLVGFLVIPLSLLVLLSPSSLAWFHHILQWPLSLLQGSLKFIDHLSFMNIEGVLTHLYQPIAMVMALSVGVLFPNKKGILLAGLLLLSGAVSYQTGVKSHAFEVNVLDIGQGL